MTDFNDTTDEERLVASSQTSGSQHAAQQRFLRHVETQARYAKRRRNMCGPETTSDVAAMVMEAIWKNEHYRESFLRDPNSVLGLVPRIARHRVRDLIRYRKASCRPNLHNGRPLLDDLDGGADACRAIERANCAEAVADLLDRFARGDGDALLFGDEPKRRLAVRAFELFLLGYSQREIAEQLDVPRATIAMRHQALLAFLQTQLD